MRRITLLALRACTTSAVLLVGCQSTVAPDQLTLPPPPQESSLSVEISGPSQIDAQGSFSWQAFAFGGSGTYHYRWEVTRQGGQQAATTTQAVATNERRLSLLVTGNDGNLLLRLTVTSAVQVKVESFAVRNCIGGCAGS
jgi:hypothetical protein